MTSNRLVLEHSVDWNAEVNLVLTSSHKGGVELVVQDARNLIGNDPGKYWDRAGCRSRHGCSSRLLVVGVTSDPTFVKRKKEVCPYICHHANDVRGEF